MQNKEWVKKKANYPHIVYKIITQYFNGRKIITQSFIARKITTQSFIVKKDHHLIIYWLLTESITTAFGEHKQTHKISNIWIEFFIPQSWQRPPKSNSFYPIHARYLNIYLFVIIICDIWHIPIEFTYMATHFLPLFEFYLKWCQICIDSKIETMVWRKRYTPLSTFGFCEYMNLNKNKTPLFLPRWRFLGCHSPQPGPFVTSQQQEK